MKLNIFESARKCEDVDDGMAAVSAKCAAVIAAVTDRKENGGTRKDIRVATIELLSSLGANLEHTR